jgi:ubiquinone/menaquinone biosynthesis C-methylase UbiE
MSAAGPPRVGSRLVDYERVADLYQKGRALSDEVLSRWSAAVLPQLPQRESPLVVADVGAGSGVFTRAWLRWVECTVVAVEPALAMVRAGRSNGSWVRGVAEALPIASGAVDVVWLSTTLHHFTDPTAAVAECSRVLADDGVVLIRTHVVDRTDLGWLRAFPGHERALARFHRLDDLEAVFAKQGWEVNAAVEVREGRHTFAESAEWAERMRTADSVLMGLTDEEMAAGVATLRAEPDRTVDLELTLVALRRLMSDEGAGDER